MTPLTQREQEALKLLADGLCAKEIGQRMGVSTKGAEYFIRKIRERTGYWSLAHLVKWALIHKMTKLTLPQKRMMALAAFAIVSGVVAITNNPFSASLTSPTPGSVVSGTVTMTALVTSAYPVDRIEFLLDPGTPTQQVIAIWKNPAPVPSNFKLLSQP